MSKTHRKSYPWSDIDLEFFRELICNRRHEAFEQIDRLRSQIVRDNKLDLDEDSEYAFHMADSASVSMDREYIYSMIDRQEKLIGYLDRALERIENKTYGICRVTGKPIDRTRLEAIPHTELSVEGKMIEKQREAGPGLEEDSDLIGL